MKTISRTFITGLVTILPIAATIYVVRWLVKTISDIFDPVAERLFADRLSEWPFVGVVIAVVFVFLIGLLMNLWVVRVIVGWTEGILGQLPLVKTLYGSVQDLMGFFKAGADDESAKHGQTVTVRIGESRVLGLLTKEDLSDLPEGLRSSENVAVYLPMSYQIGGFTVLVPRSAISPVEMSTEDAMRFAVTAGMSKSRQG